MVSGWNVLNNTLACDLWDGRKISLILKLCVFFFFLEKWEKKIFEMFGFLLVIQPALNGRNNLTGTFSASDQKEMLMWIGFNLYKKSVVFKLSFFDVFCHARLSKH